MIKFQAIEMSGESKEFEYKVGPTSTIEELKDEVRQFFLINSRAWNTPEHYYGELNIEMKFEGRPDLDVEVVEKVYKRTLTDVTKELHSLKRKYRAEYEDSIKQYDKSGSYSISFKHKTKSISTKTENYEEAVQEVEELPVTYQPPVTYPPQSENDRNEQSRDAYLYQLCEGKSLRLCYSRIGNSLCYVIYC